MQGTIEDSTNLEEITFPNPTERFRRTGSVSSSKSKKIRKNARKRRAKRWTCLVESLKASTDYLYEFCDSEKSVEGCKDAILYLTNSARDFEALIKSIEVEKDFDNLKAEGRMNVAWEIRKSMPSPSHIFKERLGQLPGPSLIVASLECNAELKELNKNEDNNSDVENDKNEWKVVQRRKRSVSSITTQSLVDEKETVLEEINPINVPPKQNVYDRLYSAAVRSREGQLTPNLGFSTSSRGGANSGRLMCPRSVMDLPQTKASMAKIAYSRQKLWQQRAQTTLAEKFKERQKLYRKEVLDQRAQSRCGINFADPAAVRKSAKAFIEKKRMIREAASAVDLRSLGSICENGEDMDAIPADPKPSDQPINNSERIRPSLVPLPPASWHGVPLDLEHSIEWREMTEEEESLANEERSLTRELENEESISIDDEIRLHDVVDDEDEEVSQNEVIKEASQAPTIIPSFQECLTKWEAEMQKYANFSWSQLVEEEFSGNYKEPGEETAKLEKISSPSRRRDISDIQEKTTQRQQRAEELRQHLLKEKAQRLEDLSKKIDNIRARQAVIYERKMALYMSRMESHEEKRNKNIAEIIKKARDDDQKVQEVIFCTSLEADLSAHEKLIREKEKEKALEQRKDRLANERQKRHEEKLAKEQAAEGRRKVAEQERVARLQGLAEAKFARSCQVEAQREGIEKEKRERRRQREERFELTKAAEVEKRTNDLKRKQIKFDSSIRRHGQTIEAVRAKAHELTNTKLFARWEALSNASAWPCQSTSKRWICIRCDQQLNSEIDIMGHIIGQMHLDASKIKAIDVTHHKLAMELCESIFECDSVQNSLTTSLVIDDSTLNNDKRKVQKSRQKIIQRMKKCQELIKESDLYKDAIKAKVRDKLIRELQVCLTGERQLRRIEHAVIDLIKQLDTNDQGLMDQFFVAGLPKSIVEMIPSLISTIMEQERIQSKLFKLLSIVSKAHPISSIYIFLCTSLQMWFADQFLVLTKSMNMDELGKLLKYWEEVLPQIGTDFNPNQQREISIRIDMFIGYLIALNLPSSLEALITKMISDRKHHRMIIEIYGFIEKLNEKTTSDTIFEFLDVLIDPLLSGIIDQIHLTSTTNQLNHNDLTSSSQSQPQPVSFNENSELYQAALNFCWSIKDTHFKKLFCNNDSRSMRLSLILSRGIHSDQSFDQSISHLSTTSKTSSLSQRPFNMKRLSLTLIERLSSLSPNHQLLFQLGGSGSTLAAICELPIQYYIHKTSRELLVKTILRIAINSPSSLELVKQHLSTKWIIHSLEDALRQSSQCNILNHLSKEEILVALNFFNL